MNRSDTKVSLKLRVDGTPYVHPNPYGDFYVYRDQIIKINEKIRNLKTVSAARELIFDPSSGIDQHHLCEVKRHNISKKTSVETISDIE